MDTPAQAARDASSALLATEIRHSAMLLGGALGLMGTFAVVLLLLTARFGS
jgi:hypothetical protein